MVNSITEIIQSNKPQGRVHELKQLSDDFKDEYNKEFDRKLDDINVQIEVERSNTLDYIAKTDCLDKLESEVNHRFDEFIKEAEESVNLDKLVVVKDKVLPVGSRFRERADKIVEERNSSKEPSPNLNGGNSGDDSIHGEPKKSVSQPIHINIRQLQIPKNWSLKDEDDVDAELKLLKRALIEELKRNNNNINLSL
ncbi:hypothetical protein [Companilactobacillus alimentarius]|uniref:Uncharacterized protein n=1 Tax=Companilactobacillus alimentarius DSM 20249 TaxID=1423720 RepID=A0A2N9YJN2_9LACO|nr:hypothetical protein [Companilactobacillus alimentarius]AUI70712.1 hypothetical protein LA20249_00010 [Companilactobacillus alimentarius DSM 20249]